MNRLVKETVYSGEVVAEPVVASQVVVGATQTQTTTYLIYYVLGAIEILLSFRLVLKILGASLSSTFVKIIYNLSGFFTRPFEGIFRKSVTEGIETASILEPSTLVAMLVYAIVAWGIVGLAKAISGEKQEGAI